MLVWLASYPRSGNTFLRVILYHAFDLKTYSLYDDLLDIGQHQATADIVGHASLEQGWTADRAQLDEGVWIVKTHDLPRDNEKAIYIVRDGREAIVSYLNYLHHFSKRDADLASVITGAVPFGSWSDHVAAWNPNGRENTLLIRFEDLVTAPEDYIPVISDFLQRKPVSSSLPPFSELHAINPAFFRSGQKDSWKTVLDQQHHLLFWTLHHDAMIEYGYKSDLPTIFERGLSIDEREIVTAVRKGFKDQRAALLKEHDNELEEKNRQLQVIKADRAARLDVIEEQGRSLGEVEAERNSLRFQLNDLLPRYEAAEADRVARLDVIDEQGRSLGEAEGERNSLRFQLNDLQQRFEAAEADRAARLQVIEDQRHRLGVLEAEGNELRSQLDNAQQQLQSSQARLQAYERWFQPFRRTGFYRIMRRLGKWTWNESSSNRRS